MLFSSAWTSVVGGGEVAAHHREQTRDLSLLTPFFCPSYLLGLQPSEFFRAVRNRLPLPEKKRRLGFTDSRLCGKDNSVLSFVAELTLFGIQILRHCGQIDQRSGTDSRGSLLLYYEGNFAHRLGYRNCTFT